MLSKQRHASPQLLFQDPNSLPFQHVCFYLTFYYTTSPPPKMGNNERETRKHSKEMNHTSFHSPLLFCFLMSLMLRHVTHSQGMCHFLFSNAITNLKPDAIFLEGLTLKSNIQGWDPQLVEINTALLHSGDLVQCEYCNRLYHSGCSSITQSYQYNVLLP